MSDCDAVDTNGSTVDTTAVPGGARASSSPDGERGSGRRGSAEFARGARIDRFVLEERLGAGAMGVVYAAHDPELDRRVAIKLILAEAKADPDQLRARLYREAQALAQVAHPNVVMVHEVGAHGGQVYIAMELVRGKTLRVWLMRPRTTDEILQLLVGAGRGLAAAHAAQLIHRDFKPENVLVGDDGRARVTDFGVARIAPGAAEPSAPGDASRGPLTMSFTCAGTQPGTPAYMAPEQLAGQSVTAACDQFSFCVTAYEALYGVRPFSAPTDRRLRQQIAAGTIAAPPRGRRVPRRVRRVLLRGLRASPAERYPSMAALVTALAAARSRPRWVTGAAALAAAGAVALALAAAHDRPEPTCLDEGMAIARQWNPVAASALQLKLTAGDAPYGDRIYAGLAATYTRYADEWIAMRSAACAANRAGDALAARTLACLDARQAGLSKHLETAMAPQAAPRQIPLLASFLLEPIATCAHPATERGPFSDTLPARQEMMAAQAQWMQGRYEDAQRQLDQLFRRLEPLHYPPIQVEVLLASAVVALGTNDGTRAEAVLRQARALAEASGDDRAKLAAATKLAATLAGWGRPDDAEQALELADATLARIGGDLALEAQLAYARARIAHARGALREAAGLFERTLELTKSVDDPRNPAPQDELRKIYVALARTSDAREARALLAKISPELADPDAGPSAEARRAGTAEADVSFLRACRSAADAGDLDRALARCSDAVVVLQHQHGKDALIVALAHRQLADVHASRGERERARDHFLAAARVLEDKRVKDNLADTYLLAAHQSIALGKAKDAVAEYRRSAELDAELGKAGERARVFARLGLGRALGADGQLDGAITELDWAIPHLEVLDTPGARSALPSGRLWLADALWRRGGREDRARASVLAATARSEAELLMTDAIFTDTWSDELEAGHKRIETWLATHRL